MMKCSCSRELVRGGLVVRLEESDFPVDWLEGSHELGRSGLKVGPAGSRKPLVVWVCEGCGRTTLGVVALPDGGT